MYYHFVVEPLVSICLPVRNSQDTIHRCLKSVDEQNYKNLEILISDDQSLDKTMEIIKSFRWKNHAPFIFQQENNLGLYLNFDFILKKANGKYFMWLAGDDVISYDYVANNVKFLESNEEFVASSSFPSFDFENEILSSKPIALNGILRERIQKLFNDLETSHNIFYSIARLSISRKFSELGKSYTALDWSYDYFLVLNGKVKTDTKGFIRFGTKGISRQEDANSKFANNVLEKKLPYIRFSKYVWFYTLKKSPSLLLLVTWLLLRLNLQHAISMLKHNIGKFIKCYWNPSDL